MRKRRGATYRTGASLPALLLTVAVAACTGAASPIPSPSTSASPGQDPRTATPSPSPATSRAATPSPGAGVLPDPGRPYEAQAILDAMRQSRRPGGVPDQLQTDAIAERVAEEIWTWDGTSWPAISAGGSCGETTCTLEVGGTPLTGAGEDLYIFGIEPASGEVTLLAAELRGYPARLETVLDAAVRDALGDERLRGLFLATARWLPPPDDGRYLLAYRSGNEESSPAADVEIDMASGEILAVRDPGG